MKKKLRAFHNDPKIKAKYLKRVRAHIKADEIIHGAYWENGKGCAVGCTIHSSDHKLYEKELGIPEWLAQLEDSIFENISEDNAKKWPERFLKAIKVGSDLEKVKRPFLVYVLESALQSFNRKKYPAIAEKIVNIITLLKDPKSTSKQFKIVGATTPADYATYASSTTYATTYAAAAAEAAASHIAAVATYAYASYAATYAAAASYGVAASYADSNIADAAETKQGKYKEFSEYLLKLLKECK